MDVTDSGAVQFPNYATQFDADAPEALRGCSPPFTTALPEIGGVQIWTGLLAKTRLTRALPRKSTGTPSPAGPARWPMFWRGPSIGPCRCRARHGRVYPLRLRKKP